MISRTETEMFSLRIPRQLLGYVKAVSVNTGLNMTDVFLSYVQVGCENKKESDEYLERLRVLYVEDTKFRIVTAELCGIMRKAYLVENFERLGKRIRNVTSMSKEEKKGVFIAMERRVIEMCGNGSIQHQAIKKWMDFNVKDK